MFYITQTQLNALSNSIYDLTGDSYPLALQAQAILIDIEQNQPCQAPNLLNAITHLRATANYAQFTAAMYPHATPTHAYALAKLHAFQDDPIAYFTTLDTTNRQRFINWILTSQLEGAASHRRD